MPVAVPAKQIHIGAHGPDVRIGEKLIAVVGMLGTIAFRHQNLDRLAEQLLPAIAEQLFRLGVDEKNEAVAIDDHQGVRDRLEHGLKLFHLCQPGPVKKDRPGCFPRQLQKKVGPGRADRMCAAARRRW